MLLKMFGEAFDPEDTPMIGAAYANVRGRDFWKERPISLGVDKGGLRARRMIQAMLKTEGAKQAEHWRSSPAMTATGR